MTLSRREVLLGAGVAAVAATLPVRALAGPVSTFGMDLSTGPSITAITAFDAEGRYLYSFWSLCQDTGKWRHFSGYVDALRDIPLPPEMLSLACPSSAS